MNVPLAQNFWAELDPTTVLGLTEVITGGGGPVALMVNDRVTLAVVPAESRTENVASAKTPWVPRAGVPLSTPVVESIPRPTGNPTADQRFPPAPPLVVNATEA